MEKKEDTYKDQVKRLEEAHKDQIKRMEEAHKDEVNRIEEIGETMQLDIASLKSTSPYWGMSLSSGNQSSSQLSNNTPSYPKDVRLIGPKWYSLKVDWIEKTLAMDAGTSRMSEDAGQRFGLTRKQIAGVKQ
ncbi:hypothetical protein LTR66_004125 [Elasticomyces elasticus]|nr:hypothetical protein LTR66_004125 [Elasticomyces elasticus]